MEKEGDSVRDLLDMDSLRISSLPQKRGGGGGGLSRYYSGKARSFSSLADAHCLDDLKKIEPEAKRKKLYRQYSSRQDKGNHQIPCGQ